MVHCVFAGCGAFFLGGGGIGPFPSVPDWSPAGTFAHARARLLARLYCACQM